MFYVSIGDPNEDAAVLDGRLLLGKSAGRFGLVRSILEEGILEAAPVNVGDGWACVDSAAALVHVLRRASRASRADGLEAAEMPLGIPAASLPFLHGAFRLADFLDADVDLLARVLGMCAVALSQAAAAAAAATAWDADADLVCRVVLKCANAFHAADRAGGADALAPSALKAVLLEWLHLPRLLPRPPQPVVLELLETLDGLCGLAYAADIAPRLTREAIAESARARKPVDPSAIKRGRGYKRRREEAEAAVAAHAAASAWAGPALDGFVDCAAAWAGLVPASALEGGSRGLLPTHALAAARAASKWSFGAFANRLRGAGVPAVDVLLAAACPCARKSEAAAVDMLGSLESLRGGAWGARYGLHETLGLDRDVPKRLLLAGHFGVLKALWAYHGRLLDIATRPSLSNDGRVASVLEQVGWAIDALKGSELMTARLGRLVNTLDGAFGYSRLLFREFAPQTVDLFASRGGVCAVLAMFEIAKGGSDVRKYVEHLVAKLGGIGVDRALPSLPELHSPEFAASLLRLCASSTDVFEPLVKKMKMTRAYNTEAARTFYWDQIGEATRAAKAKASLAPLVSYLLRQPWAFHQGERRVLGKALWGRLLDLCANNGEPDDELLDALMAVRPPAPVPT